MFYLQYELSPDLHNEPMKQRIRIKDIAKRAEVSPGTVDRVLHNRGHVSADARERVEKVLNELGYERNLLASALAYNRTYRVVALLPDPSLDFYWKQVDEGVKQAQRFVLDYGMEVECRYFELLNPLSFADQAKALMANPPSGLLFPPIYLQEALQLLSVAWLAEIPNVMINTRVDNTESLCYIGQDSYQSGVLAARLLNFGLRENQTALILNLDKGATNAKHLLDKEQGFRDYFASNEKKHIQIQTRSFEPFNQAEPFAHFIDQLLQELPDLGGVFVTNSRAHFLVNALPANMVEKIRIVGFDLIEPNLQLLYDDKIHFLINQNPQEQGYLGIINLFKHLILKEPVESLQYLPLDIVVRENVRYYLQQKNSDWNLRAAVRK